MGQQGGQGGKDAYNKIEGKKVLVYDAQRAQVSRVNKLNNQYIQMGHRRQEFSTSLCGLLSKHCDHIVQS